MFLTWKPTANQLTYYSSAAIPDGLVIGITCLVLAQVVIVDNNTEWGLAPAWGILYSEDKILSSQAMQSSNKKLYHLRIYTYLTLSILRRSLLLCFEPDHRSLREVPQEIIARAANPQSVSSPTVPTDAKAAEQTAYRSSRGTGGTVKPCGSSGNKKISSSLLCLCDWVDPVLSALHQCIVTLFLLFLSTRPWSIVRATDRKVWNRVSPKRLKVRLSSHPLYPIEQNKTEWCKRNFGYGLPGAFKAK